MQQVYGHCCSPSLDRPLSLNIRCVIVRCHPNVTLSRINYNILDHTCLVLHLWQVLYYDIIKYNDI